MVIRSTVKPHEKSPEEASEDRQRPEPPRMPSRASNGDGVARQPMAGADAASPPFQPHEWAEGNPQEGIL
jgi:hypothetical protein